MVLEYFILFSREMKKFDIYFFQIPVTLSIPSNPELHINKYSTIAGAATAFIVQYKHMNMHISHPITPHNRFDDTPDLDSNIFDINSFIFILFSHAVSTDMSISCGSSIFFLIL